jgi:putative peptidoglycan lipid II flippase
MREHITSIGWIAALTLATNLLGFVRELLVARAFGISFHADAFVAAFTIVSMCFLIFSAGALQAAFMPAYQGFIARQEEIRAGRLFMRTLKVFGGVLLILTISVAVRSQFWVGIVLPGFSSEQLKMTASLVTIMSPMIAFVGIGNLFQSVAHAERKFIQPALVPVFNNVVLIGYLLVAAASATVSGLATTCVLGASLWLIVLLPMVWKRLTPTANGSDAASFSRMAGNFWPVFILILADQVSAVVQKTLVSDLSTGSIAALNYAAKLEGIPVGIFSAAIATVYFPVLVEALASKKHNVAGQRFKEGLSGILLVSFPAAVFLCCQAETVVRVLFERGAFDAAATLMTADALFYYALGLLPQGMIVYLNRLYFSAGETRLPMRVGLISAGLHILFCWAAVKQMGFIGIAVGTTLYSLVYVIMLYRFLHRIVSFRLRDLFLIGWRFAFGAAFLSLLYALVSFPSNILGIFAALAFGAIVYFITLVVLREPLLITGKVTRVS